MEARSVTKSCAPMSYARRIERPDLWRDAVMRGPSCGVILCVCGMLAMGREGAGRVRRERARGVKSAPWSCSGPGQDGAGSGRGRAATGRGGSGRVGPGRAVEACGPSVRQILPFQFMAPGGSQCVGGAQRSRLRCVPGPQGLFEQRGADAGSDRAGTAGGGVLTRARSQNA
jgi:hypothetical protein